MSKATIQRAVTAIQKLYPTRLADSSWDNTGLLVEAFADKDAPLKILLAIDLTQAVAEEAVQKKVNLIMAYHPFIFRGLKLITHNDPQQRSLVKLIKNDISVYSPHTAVDSAYGGVNDFLSDSITLKQDVESQKAIIEDSKEPNCGMGRLIKLSKPISLETAVERVKKSLGLKYVQVARAVSGTEISTIAVCAGSGGGVFKGVKADLYYTGELSHHEALYFKELGSSVIACNHTNTERAFLKVFQKQLEQELLAEIVISTEDKDPLETW